MRLFLDTNILLDVIEARPGLVDESTEVLVRAESCLAEFIVTRNIRDFSSSPIPAMAPADFLAQHEIS